MTDPASAFAKMMPGFDFMQGLVKNAGAGMPGVGQWITPTLDPEELDKRINDLRTVQFWLEQNVRMLAATIQALEVQRMTLTTLKTMNVSFSDLTESLKIRMPAQVPAPAAEAAPPPAPAPAPAPAPEAPAAATPRVPAGVIDPMQWWGALTQQFSQLAASAMQDGANDNARTLAGDLVQQGLDAASASFRQAAAMPAAMAQRTAAGASAKNSASGDAAPAKATKATKPAAARKTGTRAKADPAARSAGKAR